VPFEAASKRPAAREKTLSLVIFFAVLATYRAVRAGFGHFRRFGARLQCVDCLAAALLETPTLPISDSTIS
jgi:hypothetical protein